MRQTVINLSGLCMAAALCGLLMQKNRFRNVVRLVIGLEIARTVLTLVEKATAFLQNWS